ARHPLARAVRADKMALAALQSVALAYLAGDGDAIPLWRMAATPVGTLRRRVAAGPRDPVLRRGGGGGRRRRRPGRVAPRWHRGPRRRRGHCLRPPHDRPVRRRPPRRRSGHDLPLMRVVATAGHVDHGKSSLVLALTGTDPDRWPEEKTRGLTIDLGFAFTTLPSGQELGFVDVPGHVRFLKNMLAGVGAVEAAILVVAATEGWMPQSEEHLRILDLLGIGHGLAVITKADLVDDDLLELARLEVEEKLAEPSRPGTGSFMPTEVLAVDSRSGRGLSELRVALDAMLAAAPLAV